jgi:hypothetical protein
MEALWQRYLAVDQPRALYTWTTPEQLAELRRGDRVLSRESSATKGHAGFDHLVSELAYGPAGSERDAADLLFRGGYAKKRFAWHTAFGAVLGLGGGPYGSVLVRITLKPNAVFYDFVRGSVTVDGEIKRATELKSFPERLGAVYYAAASYREFILVNESMIAEVSANTDLVRQELGDEIAFLEAVQESDFRARELFRAFPGKAPETPADLRPTIAALRTVLHDMPQAPFVREVSAPFQLGAKRPKLPPVCRETSRRRAPTGDVSFPFRTEVECAPTALCRPMGEMCRPLVDPFL